ncbi:MAG: hypothetical protein ACSHX4_04395 [Opitutaceae bacterium]
MHITSSYFRCRQHKDTLDLGVSGGIARVVEHAALEAEPSSCAWPPSAEPLRPSDRTLRLLASRYKNTKKNQVA